MRFFKKIHVPLAKHIVSAKPIYRATSAEVATPLKRYSERLTKGSRSLTSPSRFTARGSEGVGPDLQIRYYTDIDKIFMRAQKYLYEPAGSMITP